MQTPELNVVTGAFGFTGKYITRRLLADGKRVLTLTGHPDRPNPFGDRVAVAPFNFGDPAALTASLRGATTLFNTYWVRFPYGNESYATAVADTRTLIAAAKAAGIQRVVHVSITNASERSPFPYFQGKGVLETAIRGSGLSYAILRPTVIFGPESILINNIAWFLRRLPVFTVPGSGRYRLQPVFVEDLAALAVDAGRRRDDFAIDAVGPEIYTFRGLVRLIRRAVGSKAIVVPVTPRLALSLTRLLGRLVGDVVLTRDEIKGLMSSLLVSDGPPTAPTRFGEWLARNAGSLGIQYFSELRRHYR